ncbi:MAG: hypothetical protein RLZZ358_1003 [Bacteroidota bacterium]
MFFLSNLREKNQSNSVVNGHELPQRGNMRIEKFAPLTESLVK